MPSINVSQSGWDILLDIYRGMPHQPDVEPPELQEQVEFALDALLISYESQIRAVDEQASDEVPRTADEIRAALESALDPDISTDYEPPKLQLAAESTQLTIEEIEKADPTNPLIAKVKADITGIASRALCIVYSRVKRESWRREETTSLVARTIAMMVEQAALTNPKE